MLSLFDDYKSKFINKEGLDSDKLINGTHTIKHKIKLNIIKDVYSDLDEYTLFNA
jgi:hypothetical protein